MCTRFVLLEEHYRAVLQRLGLDQPAAFTSRYNAGPGVALPVIRAQPAGGGLELASLHWGWTPPWARSQAEKLVNLRAESIAQRGALRAALRARRGVLPASGFYEWQKRGSARQPFLFRRSDGQPFGLAALWQEPSGVAATAGSSFAVITTEPNDEVRAVHDRMPVVLPLDEWRDWLAPGTADEAQLLARLRPAPAGELASTPVSPRMNNIRYEAPDCIEPVELPATDRSDDGQFSLGL